MPNIAGNTAIENAAIDFVIEYERQQGRTARDARHSGQGGVGDVESDGRNIEVKAFSTWGLRTTGLMLVTLGQLREGLERDNYYIYIVENVAQGDRSKFELRILEGGALRRLFEGAKPQRFYVPVRAADYGRLTRVCSESDQLAMSGHTGGCPTSTPRAGGSVLPRRRAMPILDTETGKEFGSKGAAGRDLYRLVDGDITDRWVWFTIARAFPGRFHTKNSDGAWVPLDDPSVEPGTTRPGS